MKLIFPYSVFDTSGLLKLGMLSGENLALSLLWIILAAKIAVYGRMDLVVDITINTKREMRQKPFGVIFLFLYFSLILMLHISPEIRIFAYSSIRWE